MELTAGSILFAIFTGVVTGLASYFGSYTKVKAELRAATENLEESTRNLIKTTEAVEAAKAKIAAASAIASEQRAVVYSLAKAIQSLIHSMCWLSWDVKARNVVRPAVTASYDAEAHKLLPEIFSQLAVLYYLDQKLHAKAYAYAEKLSALDVEFGNAIVLVDSDADQGTARLAELFAKSNELQDQINTLFGADLQLRRS